MKRNIIKDRFLSLVVLMLFSFMSITPSQSQEVPTFKDLKLAKRNQLIKKSTTLHTLGWISMGISVVPLIWEVNTLHIPVDYVDQSEVGIVISLSTLITSIILHISAGRILRKALQIDVTIQEHKQGPFQLYPNDHHSIALVTLPAVRVVYRF